MLTLQGVCCAITSLQEKLISATNKDELIPSNDKGNEAVDIYVTSPLTTNIPIQNSTESTSKSQNTFLEAKDSLLSTGNPCMCELNFHYSYLPKQFSYLIYIIYAL